MRYHSGEFCIKSVLCLDKVQQISLAFTVNLEVAIIISGNRINQCINFTLNKVHERNKRTVFILFVAILPLSVYVDLLVRRMLMV